MSTLLEIINTKKVAFKNSHTQIDIFPAGETLFAIDKSYFKNIKDVTYDPYNPWTGSNCNGEGNLIQFKCHTYKKRVVEIDDGFYSLNDQGEFWFKVFTHRHPKTTSLNRKNELITHVYYHYETTIPVIPHVTLRKRKVFSVQEEIKEALSNRTKPEARAFLKKNGMEVSRYELTSACRTVDTHKKLKIGRKPSTNIAKLHDRYSCSINRLEKLEPLHVEKTGEKVGAVQIVTYPVAIKHLVAVLPDFRELHEHKKKIELLTDLGERESDNELNRLITTVNKSGSLPVFGTSILIDTTFGICSGEFVTIAVGVSDSFRSKASGKMSSFVIGFMIHTVKSIESHELFAKALNKRLYECSPTKRVPSIIHDGEIAFRVYNTGRILKDATPLRCQIHRAKNLKTFFKNPAEFTLFKRDLFGETQQLPHGSLLTAGALNTLNFERYEKRMTKIIESCSSEELKNWLNRNLYDLFEFDSLYSRLKGGWFVHWLSTNLLEARNAHIKAVISSPVVAHQLITEFLSMHEDELKNRLDALRGKSEVLVTPHIIENYDLLTLEERKIELCLLGLDDYLLDDEFSKFPQWVISADGKVESSMILKITNNLVVHPSSNDANVFFIESVEDSFSKYTISKVVRNVGELICFHFSCRKHRDYSYFFCVHCLSVFKTLIEPDKTECFHYLDNRRNGRTFVNLRFNTQAAIDGTKYSKRIGKQVSQGNHSRALQGIQRNSIDNILDGSYLDEEDDEDMFRFEN